MKTILKIIAAVVIGLLIRGGVYAFRQNAMNKYFASMPMRVVMQGGNFHA